ncbi:MAG TPA: glycogen-binding domain-containing protein, partial [Candidatus Ozemobacteraceae bacterium]|nr:glycogen-binding domain-containing protein [Candidatus Ozemobacteraceae bacterium]
MKKITAIEYRSDKAKSVSVAGDFNDWCGSAKGRFDPAIGEMKPEGFGRWRFSVHGIAPGRHEFKFVIDGTWEPGPNRVLHLDERGHLFD